MNTYMNPSLTTNYTSNSQKARVLTESWTQENIYCMRCGNPQIKKFRNNQPVADFYCPHCHNIFELKSHAGHMGKKIADGAYDTLIARITSNTNPDFWILEYDNTNYHVENFLTIPKFFFTPDIIEKRAPLKSPARRAGWVGSAIIITEIPLDGRIYMIKEGQEIPHSIVMDQMKKASRFDINNITSRGWLMDTLKCVDKIQSKEFSLADMYSFEDILHAKHQDNNHIRDKIRQQLQLLRDRGYIEFLGRGKYRKI